MSRKVGMTIRRQLVEEALIRTATHCFCQHGYQDTTLEDIVGPVGITRVTFYKYFESKAALLATIFDRSLADYQQSLEAILAKPIERPEKIRQVMVLQMAALTEEPQLTRLLFREEANLPQEAISAVERKHKTIDRLLEQEIKRGIQRGEVIDEDPRLLMYAFTGMCNWLYRWYKPGGSITPDEIVRVFSRVLESGALTPETQLDHGAVVRSLQQVETHLQEVRRQLAVVSQRVRKNGRAPLLQRAEPSRRKVRRLTQ